MRSKTIPQEPGPRGREIARGRGGAKCFLHQLGSVHFGSAQHGVHQLDFRKTAEERKNHRLNRQIRAFESERVPPRFQVMGRGNVPVAQGRSRILIMTEAHDVGHFLLEIGPIDGPFRFAILRNSARRIVNGIAAKNEQAA